MGIIGRDSVVNITRLHVDIFRGFFIESKNIFEPLSRSVGDYPDVLDSSRSFLKPSRPVRNYIKLSN